MRHFGIRRKYLQLEGTTHGFTDLLFLSRALNPDELNYFTLVAALVQTDGQFLAPTWDQVGSISDFPRA